MAWSCALAPSRSAPLAERAACRRPVWACRLPPICQQSRRRSERAGLPGQHSVRCGLRVRALVPPTPPCWRVSASFTARRSRWPGLPLTGLQGRYRRASARAAARRRRCRALRGACLGPPRWRQAHQTYVEVFYFFLQRAASADRAGGSPGRPLRLGRELSHAILRGEGAGSALSRSTEFRARRLLKDGYSWSRKSVISAQLHLCSQGDPQWPWN
jgi:hypothetical protein